MSEDKAYAGPHWNARDQVWFVKYKDPETGAWKSKNAPVTLGQDDRVRAVAWADEWILHQRPPALTIRELHPRWLKLRAANPKVARRTYVQNESNMRLHVLTHAIADMQIPDVSPGVLRDWVRGLAFAPFSVRNIVNSLTAFYADMLAEDEIDLPANPMHHDKVRRVIPDPVTTAGRGVILHVPLENAIPFLSCADLAIPRWRRVKDLLAMTSGLRDGELQGLAWTHIKLDGPIPYVQVDRQRHQNGDFAPPKKNSFRFIPLHDVARFALAWWKKEGWRLWTTKSPGEDDAVFPNDKGAFWGPKSGGFFRTDLAIARQPTQYAGHDLDYHATRRSFSTYLENVGVTADRVSDLLGHAAEGTAKRHYIASSMAPKLEAIRQIDLSRVSLAWLGTNQTAVSPTKRAPQIPRDSRCARTDSNGRLSASKADALSS